MPDHRQFAHGAKLYYECAIAADDQIGRLPGFEIHAPYPVMSNVAHAIELAFKSFLLANGQSNIRRFGHDLVAAFDACYEIDASNDALLDIDRELLTIISDIHNNMTLRYNEPSDLDRLPVFGPMQTIARAALRLCNAPSREDIWGTT
ncbi:MAG: hypothetical protein AAFU86_02585 [Pseudomonadota bacterium]